MMKECDSIEYILDVLKDSIKGSRSDPTSF